MGLVLHNAPYVIGKRETDSCYQPTGLKGVSTLLQHWPL